MSCRVECNGFRSLRPVCVENACVGDNLCHAIDSTIAPDTVCAEWCCVSNQGVAFALIVLFCLGSFFLAVAYWMKRLHDTNLRSGAINKDGTRAKDYWREVAVDHPSSGVDAGGRVTY